MELKTQRVYVPVDIKDELPNKKVICYRNGKKLMFEWQNPDEVTFDTWLKEETTKYLLSKEELESALTRAIEMGIDYIDQDKSIQELVNSILK